MDQPIPKTVIQQGDWFVLPAPSWNPDGPSATPPPEATVGGWMVEVDGTIGPFEPNPGYLPADDSTPSDPIDAMLRLIAAGEKLGDELVAMICHSVVEIGCGDDDLPLIGAAPDGAPCVVVATAAVQKRTVDVDRWMLMVGSDLPRIVPRGVDIMLNPSGVAPFRLLINTMRGDPATS
ncbi:type VII secretion system-associated protein [Nocardia sp. NBC_00403]|uniref:type VII secretion system-associated protein n=1 Tax=Nocardia sp. NBC_00403 TaxID=2975990 RepID=UPI002E1A25DD